MSIEYDKMHADGSVEVLRPHRFRNGKYKVEIEVDTLADVERYAASGARVRMSGPLTKQPSVVPVTRR